MLSYTVYVYRSIPYTLYIIHMTQTRWPAVRARDGADAAETDEECDDDPLDYVEEITTSNKVHSQVLRLLSFIIYQFGLTLTLTLIEFEFDFEL